MAQKHETTFICVNDLAEDEEYTVEFYFASLKETYDEMVYKNGVHIPDKEIDEYMWKKMNRAIIRYIDDIQDSRWDDE